MGVGLQSHDYLVLSESRGAQLLPNVFRLSCCPDVSLHVSCCSDIVLFYQNTYYTGQDGRPLTGVNSCGTEMVQMPLEHC